MVTLHQNYGISRKYTVFIGILAGFYVFLKTGFYRFLQDSTGFVGFYRVLRDSTFFNGILGFFTGFYFSYEVQGCNHLPLLLLPGMGSIAEYTNMSSIELLMDIAAKIQINYITPMVLCSSKSTRREGGDTFAFFRVFFSNPSTCICS